MKKICIVPEVYGVGGMVSFRGRFASGVRSRGFGVTGKIQAIENDSTSILVIGGTKGIPALRWAKTRGVRIVQRLNGMNWLQRKLKTGLKHYLRAEAGNLILRVIRSTIADQVVYQSEFAKSWWEKSFGQTRVPTSVVYNAVDLNQYSPAVRDRNGNYQMPDDRYRILMVEGSLQGGYEIGLETGIGLIRTLNDAHHSNLERPVELMIAGKVSEDVKASYSEGVNHKVVWAGLVPSEEIPLLDNSAHLLFSGDLNAACPNSVIEALACGTPVLGYDTGALPEMVTNDAGKVVQYGGDPWKLDTPDIRALVHGGIVLLNNQDTYRVGARKRAELKFGLDKMIEGYVEALFPNS